MGFIHHFKSHLWKIEMHVRNVLFMLPYPAIPYPYPLRRRSGVFIVKFEHILYLALVFLLLTLSK